MIRVTPHRGGWLEVICGPMFSGKSEEMIRRLRRAEIAGQRVVIFKPPDRRPLRRRRRRLARRHPDARGAGRQRRRAARAGNRARGRGRRRGAVLRCRHRRRGALARGRRRQGGGPPGSIRISAGCRSARCRSCSRTRSSSTSCRPSAIAAAGLRRRRSVLVDGVRRPTQATRSSSARPSSTRLAAATATSRAPTRSRSQPDLRPISATTELPDPTGGVEPVASQMSC